MLLLIYGNLFLNLLSFVFLVYCRENVGVGIRATNVKFLVKLGKSGSEIRDLLEQVYGNNAMKKNSDLQVGETFF